MMRAHGLVICLVLGGAAPRAFAQPASVQAQSLFDEGRNLQKAGKLAEACAAFDASQKLDPAVTTLLNLADCRDQNHQLATAWGAFVDANRMARASGNDKLARVASKHAHALESRLSRLTISVPADHQVAGLQVLRGSDPVDPAGWNHALPIDGGSYTITARASGRITWSTVKVIKPEADAVTVEIPKLAMIGEPPPAAEPPRPRPAVPAEPVPPVAPVAPVAPITPITPITSEPPPAEPSSVDSTEATPSYRIPIALGAGALVLGAVAYGFEHAGNTKYDNAKHQLATAAGNQALASMANARYQQANTRRYLAEGTGIAALGSAGAAVYFYLRGRSERPDATAAVTAVASPQLTGVAITGCW